MAQEVDIFKGGALPALDPEMEKFLEDQSNMVGPPQVNALSLKGKQWQITVDGETKPLMQRDKDGDEIPVSVFRGIILDWAPRRGRNYYEGKYDPTKPQMPDCWSDDGITANPAAKKIQHGGKCEGCPQSVKGSRTNDRGDDTTACQQYRLICIVPLYQLGEFPPLRQKLSITADFDGKVGEHEKDGWFAYGNYMKYLRSKGVAHSARVVTKIKFDPSVDHPKLLFAAAAFCTNEQLAAVRPMIGREDVKGLITSLFAPNAVEAASTEKDVGRATPPIGGAVDDDQNEEPSEEQTTATATAGAVSDDGDGGVTIEGEATEVTETEEERELRELQEKIAARKAAKEAAKPKETDEEREMRELKEKQAARKAAKEAEEKAAREAAERAAKAKADKKPNETDEDRELRELLEKQAARKAAKEAGGGAAKPVTKVAAPLDEGDDAGGEIILPKGKGAAAGATAKASTTGAPKPPSVAKVTAPAAGGGKSKSTLDGLLQQWGKDD